MSELNQYKALQLARFSQLILLDFNGNIQSSCDSLFAIQELSDQNVLNWFPFIESIYDALMTLEVEGEAIRFSKIETGLTWLAGVYDFTFEKVRLDGKEYILWSLYDYTDLYEGVRSYQQRRNELEIHRHLLEQQNKKLRHQKDILLRKNLLLESLNQVHQDYHQKIKLALQSPLNAIDGLTQSLSQNPVASQGEDYLSILKTSVDQLQHITRELNMIANIRSQEQQATRFKLPTVLEQVFDLLKKQTGDQMELYYEIDQQVPLYLHGEVVCLQQICYSLLLNAYRFNPKTQIDLNVSLVSVNPVECILKFTINEQNRSLPASTDAETLPAIEISGLILRLSVVRKLIELQKGNIEVLQDPHHSGLSIACQLSYRLAEAG